MADIVQSLFGLTPEAYQQRQAAQADRMALEYAQLTPMQQAQFAIGRGAYQLAGALGGALGGQDPELQRISTRNAIAQQIDYTDPQSMMAGVQALSQAGDTVGAMQLADILRKTESEMALRGQRMAATQASLAQAAKAQREEDTAIVGNALVNRRTGEVIYKPPKEFNPVVVGNALVDPSTGREIYKPEQGEPRPVVVGSALVNPVTGAVVYQSEKTETKPPEVASYEFARTPAGGNFQGTFMQFIASKAAAGRQPVQPTAPTIANIQDPTEPTRMLVVDAKVYRGGGPGSPGVIGSSGKTAPAAAAAQKQEEGISQATNIIDNLRGAYSRLDQLRAIPSQQRSVISNVLSGIAATGPGQVAGRLAGTEEQTQRDIIQSARNQLFAAVKNATGLSAQNLNSNVEFTTWLNSLTDPGRSIEANKKILDELEKFIATGGKYSAKTGAPSAPPAPSPGQSGKDVDPLGIRK